MTAIKTTTPIGMSGNQTNPAATKVKEVRKRAYGILVPTRKIAPQNTVTRKVNCKVR